MRAPPKPLMPSAVNFNWRHRFALARRGSSRTAAGERPSVRRREMEHCFVTRLSVEECKRRISELRRHPRFLEPPIIQTGDLRVFGSVRAQRFRLYASTVLARNSFRRLFYARLEATPEGTLIVGEFRVHLFTLVFMAIWLTGVGTLALIFCLAALSPAGPSISSAAGVCGMFLLGPGCFYVGQRLSSSEEQVVLSYICERLEASKHGRM